VFRWTVRRRLVSCEVEEVLYESSIFFSCVQASVLYYIFSSPRDSHSCFGSFTFKINVFMHGIYDWFIELVVNGVKSDADSIAFPRDWIPIRLCAEFQDRSP